MSELSDDYRKMIVEMKVQKALEEDRERIFKTLSKFSDSEGYVNMKVSSFYRLIKDEH